MKPEQSVSYYFGYKQGYCKVDILTFDMPYSINLKEFYLGYIDGFNEVNIKPEVLMPSIEPAVLIFGGSEGDE